MNRIDRSEQTNIVSAFIDEIKSWRNYERCLKVAISNFSVFNIADSTIQIASGFDWECEVDVKSQFGLILGDFPLGMNRVDYECLNHKLKIRRNWAELLNALKFLEKGGIAIFLVEPIGFSGAEGIKFESALNSCGYFINAIFNAPEGVLQPETSITPILVLISKNPTSSVFIAELLNETHSRKVANNYFSERDSGDLKQGMKIPEKTFHGFSRIKIKQQIEKLET